MARLIDADALMVKARWMEEPDESGIPCDLMAVSTIAIENALTVDAVPVVRCKDCKYWKPGDSFGGDSLDDMQRIGGCPIMRFARREKDFCCEGERRTNVN